MEGSLDRYRVFVQAARQGSLSLAAQSLYLSQPAVSRSIQALEESLRCSLFVRTPKGVRLTAEGETLLRYVEAGLEQVELGERKVREQLNLESGEICVGASDMTLQFFLLPYLERFHSLYPGVHIHVTNGPTPETLEALRRGRIDFGIVSEPVPEEVGCRFRPVGTIRDIFVAGERFAPFRGQTLPLAALEELPLICLEKNTSTRRYTDAFFAQNGVALAPEFELATSSLIVQFARRNLGVGCVVEDFAREALAEGSVFRLTLEKEPPPRRLCIVQGETPPPKAAARLLELIFHNQNA